MNACCRPQGQYSTAEGSPTKTSLALLGPLEPHLKICWQPQLLMLESDDCLTGFTVAALEACFPIEQLD